MIADAIIIDNNISPPNIGSLQSFIDIRCVTNNGMNISIEMQKKSQIHIPSREQEYMAKLISTEMKEGQADQHHKINPVYIIVIAQGLFFTSSCYNSIPNDTPTNYKKTARITIDELDHAEWPNSKMHWKIYELERYNNFRNDPNKFNNVNNVEMETSVLEQWLSFFLDCAQAEEIPDDIDVNIKAAYQFMDYVSWDHVRKNVYDKILQKEIDYKNEFDVSINNAKLEGLKKGLILGDIAVVKSLKSTSKMIAKDILGYTTFLGKKRQAEDTINYILDHIDDDSETILKNIDITDITY